MNNFKALTVRSLLVLTALGVFWVGTSFAKDVAELSKPDQPMKVFVFRAEGMTCGSCENRITEALRSSKNVGRIAVTVSNGLVEVEAVDSAQTPADLGKAIADAGYPARHIGYLASFPPKAAMGTQRRASGGCGSGGGCGTGGGGCGSRG